LSPTVRRTRLSTMRDRTFPVAAARVGTICSSESRPNHHCLSSGHTSLGAAFLDCTRQSYCCAETLIGGHINRSCYLLTYLLTTSGSQLEFLAARMPCARRDFDSYAIRRRILTRACFMGVPLHSEFMKILSWLYKLDCTSSFLYVRQPIACRRETHVNHTHELSKIAPNRNQ